jgi:hypothetical protein
VKRMRSPKYWRMRAEEFRTKADNCQLPQIKATLREVANDYDQLARVRRAGRHARGSGLAHVRSQSHGAAIRRH